MPRSSSPKVNSLATVDKYPFTIRPLSADGGGAVRSYLMSCKKHGDPIPKPGSPSRSSGQFRVRMPKSLHARLAAQAEREGVSLNMLMVAAAAQVLGQRETKSQKHKARSHRAA